MPICIEPRLRFDPLAAPTQHRADADAVRFAEPVDGTPTFVDVRRRGARVMQEMAVAKWSKGPKTGNADQVSTYVVFEVLAAR